MPKGLQGHWIVDYNLTECCDKLPRFWRDSSCLWGHLKIVVVGEFEAFIYTVNCSRQELRTCPLPLRMRSSVTVVKDVICLSF